MDTGLKIYRNYFPIKFGWQADIQYGRGFPCFRKIMYPGDVFKVNADLLIRYQPMLTPPMNDAIATVRFGFVPLRLIEQNTELIITGSNDGHLSTSTLPIMDSVFKYLDVSSHTSIEKHSLLDYLYNIPVGLDLSASGLLTKLDNDSASPAAYFVKAYCRFWWDYYRDENLYTSDTDFDSFWSRVRQNLHFSTPFPVCLKKDRLTSSLPWQLKAVTPPLIPISGSGTLTPNYNSEWFTDTDGGSELTTQIIADYGDNEVPFKVTSALLSQDLATLNGNVNDRLNVNQPVLMNIAGISWSQVREVGALTHIYERLARCGSRYTEYLRANYGVAPADDTLQRAQYLGGFKTRIVTTEVIQTAADGANPVGTLRGHGITHGTSTIKPFMAKEIGVIIGILDVKPETIYAQGVDRELTARSRFDFMNPSFQHLSEQEVRKGEIYFSTDTDESGNLVNSQTWGFQPYAQELRTGVKHVVGDMRDSLSYWNQALIFSSRPSLNNAFVSAANHTASYNRPFAVSSASAYPMIVDFGGVIEAYRPLVKNGTPGLVDHN